MVFPNSQTIKDLERLNRCGISLQIKEFVKKGGNVFGICGGLQMLGRTLKDPLKIEDTGLNRSGQNIEGLGVIPIETNFTSK